MEKDITENDDLEKNNDTSANIATEGETSDNKDTPSNNNDTSNNDKAEMSKSEKADVSESKKDDEYEKVCYVCRRPESKAGKMLDMPGGISVCTDCLQKSLNSFQNIGMNVSMTEDELRELLNKPGVHMTTFGDLQRQVPDKQKVKKKKSEEDKQRVLDINKIPAPHIIKGKLDEYVIGQEHAKKVMSVAVYNHYKRVANNAKEEAEKEKSGNAQDPAVNKGWDDVEIEKSNMLMIGPTGSGKTYMVKTLAKLLDVPLAITDATSLTEAGYIGDDIESVVSKLLAAADNDVKRAETGIIFIDEIDKIAKKQNTSSRDVSGESVQQGMLKLLEGSEVEVPVGATSKNAMVPLATVNTKNILFICGGAFPDLEDIIKERLNKQAAIGFQGDLTDKYDKTPNLISQVTTEDLRKFGMIPEFLGRLPIVFTLDELTEDMLVQILTDPKNAIIKQYQKLLEMDEVTLEFTDDALRAIAKKAIEKKTGARALRAMIEELMLDIMYEIPKDKNIGTVRITKEYIDGTGVPVIGMRGQLLPDNAEKN